MTTAIKPLFLIVTPSYNQAQFIGTTLESVLSQQGDFEIDYVVMDGGSTDGTVSILKDCHPELLPAQAGDSGSTFTFQSESDQGQSDALNKGIRYFQKLQNPKSNSRNNHQEVYFSYINSDDYYLPGALAKVAQAFADQPNKMWLVGDCQIVDQDGKRMQKFIQWYKQIWRWIFSIWPASLFVLNPIPQPAVFIRWEAVQQVGLFETKLKYVMDYQYWLKLKQWYGLPILLTKTLAAFRIHGQSKGGSQYYQQFAEELQVAESFNQNYLILGLHRLHNWLIRSVYDLIK